MTAMIIGSCTMCGERALAHPERSASFCSACARWYALTQTARAQLHDLLEPVVHVWVQHWYAIGVEARDLSEQVELLGLHWAQDGDRNAIHIVREALALSVQPPGVTPST